MSAEDRVKAAYALAIEDGWDEAEIDEVDPWRRAVRGSSKQGPREPSDEPA